MRGKRICQFSYIGSRRRFSLLLAKVGCRQLLTEKFEVFEKFRIPKRIWFRSPSSFRTRSLQIGERTQATLKQQILGQKTKNPNYCSKSA